MKYQITLILALSGLLFAINIGEASEKVIIHHPVDKPIFDFDKPRFEFRHVSSFDGKVNCNSIYLHGVKVNGRCYEGIDHVR